MFYEIGNKINKLMMKEGISGMQLAKKLGIPASTFKKIRSKEITNPTLATLVPIARYFSVPLEYFLEPDITMQQHQMPLLSWDEVKSFPAVVPSLYVKKDHNYGMHVFALYAERHHDYFPIDSLLIVDPSVLPQQNDFIIIKNSTCVALKQFNHSIDFPAETKLIGVVIEYQREFHFKNPSIQKE